MIKHNFGNYVQVDEHIVHIYILASLPHYLRTVFYTNYLDSLQQQNTSNSMSRSHFLPFCYHCPLHVQAASDLYWALLFVHLARRLSHMKSKRLITAQMNM